MYTLIVTTSSGTTQKEWKHEKYAFASFNGICMAMVRNNESGIVQMLKGGEVVMENVVNPENVSKISEGQHISFEESERIRELKSFLKGTFPKLLCFSPTDEKGVYEAKTDSGESVFMIEED